MSEEEAAPPVWDDTRALAMIGAKVLIGITYVDGAGSRQEQMFGHVISADSGNGFEVQLEGSRAGDIFWIPPDLEAFDKAEPGCYELKTTQEVVVDPDYTTTWTVRKQDA